jgi:calcium-translocating P-type ATPase
MPAVRPAPSIAKLAPLSPDARLELLGSRPSGLSGAEAALRLRRHGRNDLSPPRTRQPLFAFVANFTHTLALLLWFAAGLAFAAGLHQLGGAIVAVVAVNGLFAFAQEYRAGRTIAGLMRRVAVQARVVRDGVERTAPAVDLAPGDVVRLAPGDIVPADCVLLSADHLTLDLSMLTGESAPVGRSPETVQLDDTDAGHVADIACAAPSGAGVVSGLAQAAVYATGAASTMGAIATMVESVERGASVLERQVAELSRMTAALAVGAGAITLVVAAVSTDVEFVAALTFAVGVLVALVPEGLLPTLSVALAIGAERMAHRGAAVRRLSSVEAIGAATVICTDKTGTLTQNTLSVRGFVSPDGSDRPSPRALAAAILCNDARVSDGGWSGDPVDVALVRWAGREHDAEAQRLREAHPRISDVPFDARWRYMSVTCEVDGVRRELIKGAPEEVLRLLGATAPAAIERATAEATLHGERVLLLAERSASASDVLGLVRLFDPPRPEVPAAIAACRRASVRVVMLTGDHPGTASALAKLVGIGSGESARGDVAVVSGAEMDALGDRALLRRLRDDTVFARIDPRQKLRITELLRRSGDIVVVTGDGINDAPALRAADVGVAMGRRGTEVAKQAADVVLADDNFATIVAAIEEGRSIKENIRRFVSYVFTSNVAELAPFLLYIFLPVPLPLAVVQVLALDLGTDLLPAMALGAEPPAARSMVHPPEPPSRPLLTRALGIRTFLFFGLIEAALGIAGFLAYHWQAGWRPFDSFGPHSAIEDEARALTFLGIVAGQMGCVLAQRDGPLRSRLDLRVNPLIAWGLAFELALALALVYVPGLNGLFSMAAVYPAWLAILPAGAAVFVLLDHGRRLLAGARERGG